jgi:HAD superfamily hydrolase (TIGR01484 family)
MIDQRTTQRKRSRPMRPVSEFKQPIELLFTDIDDTLTIDGRLPAQSYEMLWKLQDQGVQVVPVTGRPAGWCEMIARQWPVLGVIGENGALAFQYQGQKMQRLFAVEESERLRSQKKLQIIQQEILQQVPGAALASDQFTRLFDLAIDFCEDVPALTEAEVKSIVRIFQKHGATAKVSSIHVNGWFGNYNKASMCEQFYQKNFGHALKDNLKTCAFVGDSPNDEPLFAFFENSFAVANIHAFVDQLKSHPRFVATQEGGMGFVEVAHQILSLKSGHQTTISTGTQP